MAQQGGNPPWVWDQQRRVFYYIDEGANQIVFPNGIRVDRPNTVPRQLGQQPLAQPSPQQYLNTTSLGNYTHTVGNQQNPVGQSLPQPLVPQWPHPYGQMPAATQAGSSSYVHGSSQLDSYQTSQAAPQDMRLTGGQSGYAQSQWQQQPNSSTTSFVSGGLQYTRYVDSTLGFQTNLSFQPANCITDPDLLRQGRGARARLIGDRRQEEQLFKTYKVKPSSFFIFGRVFQTLWSQPAGATKITTRVERVDPDPGFSQVRFGETVHTKIRRFVVVRAKDTYCSAVPISTYGGRGVAKPGVNKSEHVIVYSGNQPPAATAAELPGPSETGMRNRPIRVVKDAIHNELDLMSRIDLGKVYTIEYNVKVKAFGVVHQDSMVPLDSQFRNVFQASSASTVQPASQRNREESEGSDSDSEDSSDEEVGNDEQNN